MDKIEYYKDRFESRTDDQLKDIIAGSSMEELEIEAVTAALQLLKERQPQTPIPIQEIPKANRQQLEEIIANPKEWGQNAVDVAKRTLLRLDHTPIKNVNQLSKSTKIFIGFILLFAIAGIAVIIYYFFWILLFIFGAIFGSIFGAFF
jgi:hypothetical protein